VLGGKYRSDQISRGAAKSARFFSVVLYQLRQHFIPSFVQSMPGTVFEILVDPSNLMLPANTCLFQHHGNSIIQLI